MFVSSRDFRGKKEKMRGGCWVVLILAASVAESLTMSFHRQQMLAKGSGRLGSLFASSEDESNEVVDNNETSALYASLRSRKRQVDMESTSLTLRWRKGRCASRVVAALGDDWCRRCALDYPLVALGTASGAVHVVDVSKPLRSLITDGKSVHPRATEADTSSLHGTYDGGGVTAIDLKGTTVATGGREGEVKLWRVGAGGTSLTHEATMECDGVVSDVKISSGTDFAVASCLGGCLRRFEWSSKEWRETWKVHLGSEALCLALSRNSSLIACGLADGSVKILDSSTGAEARPTWKAFENVGARSVSFGDGDDDGDDWMYAGCMDGNVKRRKSEKEEKLLPCHQGPVVSMTQRKGILATAGQDSTVRIWDIGPRSDGQPPRCLFAFNGYKVWIGSVDCDEQRLISDGSDNTIIMHDFGEEKE